MGEWLGGLVLTHGWKLNWFLIINNHAAWGGGYRSTPGEVIFVLGSPRIGPYLKLK